MTKEEFLKTGLCEQYVLGLTTPEENDLVEAMLQAHPELKKECMGLESCMEKYARAHAITPPERLRESVLSNFSEPTIKSNLVKKAGITIPNWAAMAIAASFIGLLFFSFTNWNEKNRISSEKDRLSSNFTQFQKDCREMEEGRKLFAAQNAFLQDDKTVHIHLMEATNPNHPMALVFWNESKEDAYIKPLDMPPPPAGKTYQLWADIDNEMVNMGIVHHNSEHLLEIPHMENASSLNITLEESMVALEHPDVSQLKASGAI